MATPAHTTPSCPRLDRGASPITTADLVAVLTDASAHKRRGTLRAVIVRHIPKLDRAATECRL